MLIEFKLCYDDEAGKFVALNEETGEVRDFTPATKKATSTRSTKKKVDENPNPQLTLEDNKYSLNTAAVELMGLEPEMKLCIKMKKIDNTMMPIIGTNEAFKVKDGNRLTKSFTVACRGANHDALANYGTIFDLEANPNLEGTFILKGDKGPVIVHDENISESVEIPEDLEGISLNEIGIDDTLDTEEVDGSMFESLLSGV
jgi:hypothetical protein